jgi:hypothetical protein
VLRPALAELAAALEEDAHDLGPRVALQALALEALELRVEELSESLCIFAP